MIQRRPLRAEVRDEILDRVVRGELAAGSRINESHLAAELKISRTPLRETLITLVDQGLLTAKPGRGFQVPPLDPVAVVEVGEILALLEPRLVKGLVPAAPDLLVELGNEIARARLAATDPARFPAHLRRFALALARRSTNRHLGVLVVRQTELTARYVGEAVSRAWNPTVSLERLQEVVEALRHGDRAHAGEAMLAWRRDLTAALVGHLERDSSSATAEA